VPIEGAGLALGADRGARCPHKIFRAAVSEFIRPTRPGSYDEAMKQGRPLAAGQDQMKAIFWTISIMAVVLFGLGSAVDQLSSLF